ncbi:MAG: guanine deaminase [Spirochaetaceae bacterium]|nr:MAG: guanine deaminase [Spirochaetaceae bacterium]
MHTPANPFESDQAFESFADGAVVFKANRILSCGPYAEMREKHPEADIIDERGAYLLPGFVDTHVHFPQLTIIGAMGLPLLEWLRQRTLPAEAALSRVPEAEGAADLFLERLAANGTTTALVFGSHILTAQDAFFRKAANSGLRITSGLVLGDQNLLPELETTVGRAREETQELIARYHGHGNLRYAVTPRFSVSCSGPLLEVCGELLESAPGLYFQTHINENKEEINFVRGLFPSSRDYFDTYERYGLAGKRSVFAHNLHVSDSELSRMGTCGCSVAHCPSSNSFLGSGTFPMARHIKHGVAFGLGCDVGAGSGFSLFNESLRAYETQMLREDGYRLSPRHLLYLSGAAGARVMGLEKQIGDFTPEKEADFVLIRPPANSTLRAVLERAASCEAALGALFTLAREESVAATYVAGRRIHPKGLPA